jgi:IMP dehydrogenase
MNKHRLERVLVVNDAFELRGLITVKDIQKSTEHPLASKDSQGKLLVGAAVGVGAKDEERIELLVAAGVDVLVVDTAHGHSQGILDRVKWIKTKFPQVDVIGGNIATAAAAKRWSNTAPTRSRSVSARLDLHHPYRRWRGRAADHRHLQRGRSAGRHGRAMYRRRRHPLLGRYLQSTGSRRIDRDDGLHVRRYRRSAGRSDPVSGPFLQVLPRHGFAGRDVGWFGRPLLPGRHHEGRQVRAGRYRRPRCLQGQVLAIIFQLVGGVRQSMGYCGCATIEELRNKAEFVEITSAGMRESHVHDVQITKEAPNYRSGD